MNLDPETIRKLQELNANPPTVGRQLQKMGLANQQRPQWHGLAIAAMGFGAMAIVGSVAVIMANSPQAQLTRQQEAAAALAMESAKQRGWNICILAWDCPKDASPAPQPTTPAIAPAPVPAKTDWVAFWDDLFRVSPGSAGARRSEMDRLAEPERSEAIAAFNQIAAKYNYQERNNDAGIPSTSL